MIRFYHEIYPVRFPGIYILFEFTEKISCSRCNFEKTEEKIAGQLKLTFEERVDDGNITIIFEDNKQQLTLSQFTIRTMLIFNSRKSENREVNK